MMQELGREELPQRLDAQMEARIGAGQLVIPVLPAVASTVLGMIDDPDAEIARLAHTIQHDPAIAAHVMRIANSASLRGGAPIVSLQQAITRLGMRSIADIALAACMGPKLFNASRHGALLERIWSESLATALWSREIARTLRRNVEVAFLSGLMHQIGKPVLLQALQEMLPGQGEQLEESLLLALLERHAAAAGLAVATHWGLPEPVAETIAHLGDFSRSARAPDLVAMVSVARAIALQTLGEGMMDAQPLMELPEMVEINLYLADARMLLEKADSVRAMLSEIAA